jgi:hypothetical protein
VDFASQIPDKASMTIFTLFLFLRRDKPVIRKALVDLKGSPMACFAARRAAWSMEDSFRSPGPIQVRLWPGEPLVT